MHPSTGTVTDFTYYRPTFAHYSRLFLVERTEAGQQTIRLNLGTFLTSKF